MSNEQLQHEIDQVICRAVLEGQINVNRDNLAVGSKLCNFEVRNGPGWSDLQQVVEATVEQRHLDAVALFRANYPLGWNNHDITFRCAPAAE